MCFYRQLKTSRAIFGKLSSQFEEAQASVTKLSQDPGNEAKLKLYALYKQVRVFVLLDRFVWSGLQIFRQKRQSIGICEKCSSKFLRKIVKRRKKGPRVLVLFNRFSSKA